MKNSKLFTALLAIAATIVTLIPATAVAASKAPSRDASVVGRGTWALGTAAVTCVHQPQANPVLDFLSADQCGYAADSAPDEQSKEGCTEVAQGKGVAGCRAVLKGQTQRSSGLTSFCMQGGLFDLTAEYPAGPPDGHVTIESAALNTSFVVPVSITVTGAFGHVYGTRLLDSGPVSRVVVEGRFLWNLQPEQSCPYQGGQPTPGIWQGTYTFWDKAV